MFRPGAPALGPGCPTLGPGTPTLGPGSPPLGPGTPALGPGARTLSRHPDVRARRPSVRTERPNVRTIYTATPVAVAATGFYRCCVLMPHVRNNRVKFATRRDDGDSCMIRPARPMSNAERHASSNWRIRDTTDAVNRASEKQQAPCRDVEGPMAGGGLAEQAQTTAATIQIPAAKPLLMLPCAGGDRGNSRNHHHRGDPGEPRRLVESLITPRYRASRIPLRSTV